MLEVTKAKYLHDYRIQLEFNDGCAGVVDLRDDLWGKAFAPLKDIEVFKNFKLEIDTIAWPNGADFAPEFLHDKLKQR